MRKVLVIALIMTAIIFAQKEKIEYSKQISVEDLLMLHAEMEKFTFEEFGSKLYAEDYFKQKGFKRIISTNYGDIKNDVAGYTYPGEESPRLFIEHQKLRTEDRKKGFGYTSEIRFIMEREAAFLMAHVNDLEKKGWTYVGRDKSTLKKPGKIGLTDWYTEKYRKGTIHLWIEDTDFSDNDDGKFITKTIRIFRAD